MYAKLLPYNREAALAYAAAWADSRNQAFYDYSDIGGDCTNFASQCIYAGAPVMNFRPVHGWYYRSANDKTPSWTGVPYLFQFLTTNTGPGPVGEPVDADHVQPGDIVQLGDEDGRFYHCPVVVSAAQGEILVAAHSYDAYMRPLRSYIYSQARFVHITGYLPSNTL